jgi:hypothetical protein
MANRGQKKFPQIRNVRITSKMLFFISGSCKLIPGYVICSSVFKIVPYAKMLNELTVRNWKTCGFSVLEEYAKIIC